MGNKTLTHAIIYLLIGLALATIVFSVLIGKNGLINQEKEHYNETHAVDK